jgi:hypothetical protein
LNKEGCKCQEGDLTCLQVAYTGAVRALVEMGVFEALPMDGTSLSADILAEKLKVEKDLLVRLMRVAIPE